MMCQGASILRGIDIDAAIAHLQSANKKSVPGTKDKFISRMFKTEYDLAHSIKIMMDLKKMSDYDLRIESPYISIYTNDAKSVSLLEKKYEDQIRYISKPASPGVLEIDTIIMPKLQDYDYKITLAASRQEHSAFVEWAESNGKIRITKSCKRDLLRPKSWGGTHFYVKGDNTLLMAKMHLSGCIGKIQRIVKQ